MSYEHFKYHLKSLWTLYKRLSLQQTIQSEVLLSFEHSILSRRRSFSFNKKKSIFPKICESILVECIVFRIGLNNFFLVIHTKKYKRNCLLDTVTVTSFLLVRGN